MDPACAQVPGWVGPDYTAAIQEEDVTFAFGVAVRCRLLSMVMLSTVIYCYLLLSTQWPETMRVRRPGPELITICTAEISC